MTGSRVNAETPITSSVHTFEPQSIISHQIIQDSLPATSDFSDAILLTPGASGTSNGNGPGLSESKTVLRGFQDGQYNITYDGIPFGDSNDPTHHSTAYFPNGTYERIIVDRGPGHATDLGQASYGGNVHIVSRELQAKPVIAGQAVYGSYNTQLYRGEVQSGAIDKLGGLRLIGVGEYKRTDGALTASKAQFYNIFGKLELPLGDNAKFSLLASYNNDYYNQADNNGATCNAPNAASVGGKYAQGNIDRSSCTAGSHIALYGTTFGLVDFNNPTFAGSPYPASRFEFNWTKKVTDFEIARLQVNLTGNLSFDNKAYTYFYKNFTYSSDDVVTPCATSTTTTCGAGTVAGTPAGLGTQAANILVNGVITAQRGDITGFTKLNQYRQWGDVGQFNWTTPIGIAHAGFWYEGSTSHRYGYDYDTTKAFAAGAIKDGFFDFTATQPFYNFREKAGPLQLNGQPVPQYIKYDENTGWAQIQLFGEFEFKFFDDRLTITPGYKFGRFQRTVDSPIAVQKVRIGAVSQQTYKPSLPYATVNFLIRPNWSVYGQFAKGFLIPSLGVSFEVPGLNPNAPLTPQPTKTTNYQAGTVFAGDRLNIDLDGYYITLSNTTTCDPSTNICTQSGVKSIYKGVEGAISYLMFPGLTVLGNGSIQSSKVDTDLKQWVPQAPNYTALAGVVYRSKKIKFSYLHKFIGRQYADAQTGFLNPTTVDGIGFAGGGIANQVRIAPYSNGTAAASIGLGAVEVGVTVYNVFDTNPVTKIGGSTAASTAQYFFQPHRSYQAQVRVRF